MKAWTRALLFLSAPFYPIVAFIVAIPPTCTFTGMPRTLAFVSGHVFGITAFAFSAIALQKLDVVALQPWPRLEAISAGYVLGLIPASIGVTRALKQGAES